MKVTQDWKRKRTAHKSACWDCYRCHRGCDGARPCKRCISLGRAASCRDPTPTERNPTKPKPNIRKDQNDRFHRASKEKEFYIIDPLIFTAPKYLQTSTNKETSATTPPSFTASSRPNQRADFEYGKECNEQASVGMDFIVHYEEPQTSALQKTRLNGEKLIPFNHIHQQSIFDRPHSATSYIIPRRQTRITRAYEVPPSAAVEALMEEILVDTEEIGDHRTTTTSVFKSLPVPGDMLRLCESIFTPFGLRDSTQVRNRLPPFGKRTSLIILFIVSILLFSFK